MAHHRGLVITLVIAVVVAVVGIGVMALSTNDTDESVQEELAPSSVNHYLAGDPTPNRWNSIPVVVYCAGSPAKICSGKITPLWDSWNNCVDEDYTKEQDFQTSPTTSLRWRGSLGVTDKCSFEHSQMHWNVVSGEGTGEAQIHIDAGSGSVHFECGAVTGRVKCNANRGGGGNPAQLEFRLCPAGSLGC